MNTHLHILEACTSLLKVWRDPELLQATTALLEIFLDIIQDARTGHMGLFFDADWRRMDRNVSYGHDIEASWLLLECAEVIDEPALYERTLQATERMAVAALEGRRDDDKAGFWKCPYHNGRMCMEVISRLNDDQ